MLTQCSTHFCCGCEETAQHTRALPGLAHKGDLEPVDAEGRGPEQARERLVLPVLVQLAKQLWKKLITRSVNLKCSKLT